MQLEGKVALVTGGARGLGRSMALAYAREGADVAIVARTNSELETVGSEIRALGRRAHTVNAELTTSEGAGRAVRETVTELGKIDILVNNAGGYRLFTNDLTHSLAVLDTTEEEWRRVMESNLTTTFMTCKAVLPHMMERGSGVIVNLTSKNVARRGPGRAVFLRCCQGGGGTAQRVAGRRGEGLWHCRQHPRPRLEPDQAQRRLRRRSSQAHEAARRHSRRGCVHGIADPRDHDRPTRIRL